MLRWRLLLGTLLIAALVGLCWLDAGTGTAVNVLYGSSPRLPGGWLMPVALIAAWLATRELLEMAAAADLRPARWPVYLGNLWIVVANWYVAQLPEAHPSLLRDESVSGELIIVVAHRYAAQLTGQSMTALVAAVFLVLLVEMYRYEKPGKTTANVATAAFALVYVGVMLSFAVGMRVTWGIGALAAWIIVVKMGDTGAYFVGRLIGRHKMAPSISPGKTIEGAIGALIFSCLGSWLAFTWVVPWTRGYSVPYQTWWQWIAFGLLVGTAGMIGDLAESLLKRDVGRKDSSDWMPGFGGVLDILDSLLLSAPVAWFCWASGMV
jgi:phosphatidate cytidylyltransferase